MYYLIYQVAGDQWRVFVSPNGNPISYSSLAMAGVAAEMLASDHTRVRVLREV